MPHKDPQKNKEYKKEYYQKNKYKLLKRAKEYRKKNKDIINKYAKIYREKNKERLNHANKEWYQKNKEYIKEYNKKNKKNRKRYEKKRYDSEPIFKLIYNMRRRMYNILKGTSKLKHTVDYLGCSREDWIKYLERHGQSVLDKSLHIDHIKPCNVFKWKNIEQDLHNCFHYSNTRLMNGIQNISESDNFAKDRQILYKYYKLNGPKILEQLKSQPKSL